MLECMRYRQTSACNNNPIRFMTEGTIKTFNDENVIIYNVKPDQWFSGYIINTNLQKRTITSSMGKPNCSTFTLQNTSNHDFSRRDPVRYPCRHQRDDDPELFPSRRLGTVQCTRDYPIRTNDCRLIHVYRSAGDGPWHPDHNTIYE